MTPTNRFDGKSEIYAKARPKYAAELFDTFSVDNRIEVPMETVAYIGVV